MNSRKGPRRTLGIQKLGSTVAPKQPEVETDNGEDETSRKVEARNCWS